MAELAKANLFSKDPECPVKMVVCFNPKEISIEKQVQWTQKEGAITDEPPAEVAAAGHDRCIIPIKPENIDAWLNPDPTNLAASYAILDDRERPYYEHRMAA